MDSYHELIFLVNLLPFFGGYVLLDELIYVRKHFLFDEDHNQRFWYSSQEFGMINLKSKFHELFGLIF